MICIPIVAPSAEEAKKKITAAADADLLELRLDYIEDIDNARLSELISASTLSLIITDRKNRMPLMYKALEDGADYIDIDISAGEDNISSLIEKKGSTRLIISYHDYDKTDKKEIFEQYENIRAYNPDIVKIAAFANNVCDNLHIFDLLTHAGKEGVKIVSMCMGEKGQLSRILGVLYGSEFTFGSLSEGNESAPGQITAEALRYVYDIKRLKNPKIFGLVGNPVSHSIGVNFHNDIFKIQRADALYVNFLVDDIGSFVSAFRNIVSGFSVTIPYKTDIIGYLDSCSGLAEDIASVNTVISNNGRLTGFNTDVPAAVSSLKEVTSLKAKKLLLLGAGGVGRALAYGFKAEGAVITLVNRTLSKAEQLASELSCAYLPLNRLDSVSGFDIIVNATSLGMYPDVSGSPLTEEQLKNVSHENTVVFDTVYNPEITALLNCSLKLDLKTVGGKEMFLRQAQLQSELFLKEIMT